MEQRIRVTLAGNPNTGKTSVFNALTGARHHVGNYPGVTVERRWGQCRHNGREISVSDLPGTYSLSPWSLEETVARDHLIDDRPDVVVDVVDATNLERNLYLAVQLLEMDIPLVLALNMSDVARARGLDVDTARLTDALGVRVVRTEGHRGRGIDDLLDAVVETAGTSPARGQPVLDYGEAIEREIRWLERGIARRNGDLSRYRRRWLALELLEGDEEVRARVGAHELVESARFSVERLRADLDDDPAVAIGDRRYRFITELCGDAVRGPGPGARTRSDRIDAVLTHRLLGLPIFLGLMYLVFQATFAFGNPFMTWIEHGFAWLGAAVSGLWPAGADSPLESMIVDGVIGGVGGVLVFLPNIVFLFLAISLLEDSGYMARAAFMMDRLMQRVGLHGKSFIPMLIGFGCNVPAIMATRTLESRRDRLTTMLIIPLMSCSARLTIYALIIPAFFPLRWQAPMLWTVYVIGIVLAIAAANLLRTTLFRGEPSDFVMEMPSYRLPTLRGVAAHMWDRSWLYVRKAGTIILGISIVLWAISTFPHKRSYDVDYAGLRQAASAELGAGTPAYQARLSVIEGEKRSEELAYSIVGRLGRFIEPVLRPMGFDWRIGTAMIGAFAAKEVFVAQMGIVYAVGDADNAPEALRADMRRDYAPLVGFCIMLFALIGTPCMATLAVTRRESGSWRWALFQFAGLTGLAYVLTTIVFQVGRLAGLGI